jgi:hypothetical protein
MGALFFALITYGARKRWRWVFWGYVLLLCSFVLSAIQPPNGLTIDLFVELILGLIAASLLTASVVALIRFGPWAMKKVHVTARSQP